MMIKKIFIVDDHAIVREGLKQTINMENDMEVCGEADSVNSAIEKISRICPDLAIIDISLNNDSSGLDLLKAIKERFYSVKTIVLSMYDESIYAERAIRAGSRGYITKKRAHSDIIDAIRKVLDGELYLDPEVSLHIIDKLFHGTTDSLGLPINRLSNRELEVFQLIGNGVGTTEISHKLNMSVNTVQSHKRRLKAKLSLKSSGELIKNAVQWVQSQRK